MKMRKLSRLILSGVVVLGACSLALAQDVPVEPEDPVEIADDGTGNSATVENAIAEDFADFAGDDSSTLVQALRDGEDLSYDVEMEQGVVDENGNPVYVQATNEDGTPQIDDDGDPVFVQVVDENGEPLFDENGDPVYVQETELVTESISFENTNGGMGYGEISLALGLAQSQLGDGASLADISESLFNIDGTGILDKRAAGMGWGQIFGDYDLTVGEVISTIKSNGKSAAAATIEELPARQNGIANRSDSAGQARLEKVAKPVRPEKAERPERPEKAARPERPERPVRPERADRPERPERPELPERPGRS